MKNNLLFLFVALFLIIFLSSFFLKKRSERKEIAFNIINEIIEKYEEKYGLQFCGISESAPEGVYRDLGVCFDYDSILTKSEGRKILTDIVTFFLESINSKENFKKYLQDVPFTGENVTVSIYVKPGSRSEVYYPDITIFSFYGGKLRYKYDTPETEKKGGNFYLTETETLEEAKEILRLNQ